MPGPKGVEHHIAEGKWVHESELVRIFQHLEKRAVALARAKPGTLAAAKLVMDAVLGGLSFTHFPPFRPVRHFNIPQ